MKITVLSFYDRISLFHSLKPFLFSRHKDLFTFTNKPDYCLKKDKKRILSIIDKLAISWNIGVGDFPKLKYRQRSAVALARTFGATAAKLFHKNSVLSPDRKFRRTAVNIR